jgi:hypothetical protein
MRRNSICFAMHCAGETHRSSLCGCCEAKAIDCILGNCFMQVDNSMCILYYSKHFIPVAFEYVDLCQGRRKRKQVAWLRLCSANRASQDLFGLFPALLHCHSNKPTRYAYGRSSARCSDVMIKRHEREHRQLCSFAPFNSRVCGTHATR